MKNGFHYIIHILTFFGIILLLSTNSSKQNTIELLSNDTGKKRLEIEVYNINIKLDSMKSLIKSHDEHSPQNVQFSPKSYYVVDENDGEFEHDMNYMDLIGTLENRSNKHRTYYVIGELQLNDYSIHYSALHTLENFNRDDKFRLWDEQTTSLLNSMNIGKKIKYRVISKKAHIFFSYSDASKFRSNLQ